MGVALLALPAVVPQPPLCLSLRDWAPTVTAGTGAWYRRLEGAATSFLR